MNKHIKKCNEESYGCIFSDYKLWLDDVREAPTDYMWCKTAEHAIGYMYLNGLPEHISFDHDLGDGGTGVDVAEYIVREVGFDSSNNYHAHEAEASYSIHSSNPVGRDNIRRVMDTDCDRYRKSICEV